MNLAGSVFEGKNFLEKRQKLKAEGADKLMVVADFDRTLTPYTFAGKPASTSWYLLGHSGLLGKNFSAEMDRLFGIYYPIENDHRLADAERFAKMREWWLAVFDLMKSEGYSRQKMEEMVALGLVRLREGVPEFFAKCNEAEVPLLIFSAGVGDVIKKVLADLPGDKDIIANFGNFTESGEYLGYTEPVVHSMDKNERLLDEEGLRAKYEGRKNVLLMGDHLKDADMIEGANHETVLRVGFLNTPSEINRQVYREVFDLVLEGDGDFRPVNELTNWILG